MPEFTPRNPAATEGCKLVLEARDLRASDEGAAHHDCFKDGFEFASIWRYWVFE